MSWDDVARRVAAGESLEAVAESLRPPAEQELLRRSALVPSFDREVFERVLRGDATGDIDFPKLIASDAVEPVPRTPGHYRVRGAIGRRYLAEWKQTWTQDRRPLEALSSRLADLYGGRGPDARLDLLGQLVLADPAAARHLFVELFDEADARFDLARCLDTVDVLGDRLPFLTPELVVLRDERRLYVDTRSLFADDYYRSARHLERESLTAEAETLLGDRDHWIMQLYATGGMGKTMFLRWLISRRWVPEPRRIACARLDFDHVERAAESWRLLVLLAEQLNRQLPQAPFQDILAKAAEAETLTGSRAEAARASLAADVPPRFAAILAETRPIGSTVIVVDTLEEALLHQGGDVLGLVKLLAEVRDHNRALRLILSGRYDVRKRLNGFAEQFGAVTSSVEVARFSADEARRFLTGPRRLTADPRLDLVVERADGSPFKLALFADLLAEDPTVTAETIRAYPTADLAYLIERVVDRIRNERVQWLVRYGVIPRRLTFPFVRDVMAKYLPPAMSGPVTWDEPRQGLPEAAVRGRRIFPNDLLASPAERLDLSALWRQLVDYAAEASWVTPTDEPETIRFHDDVLDPMRRLLQGHDIVTMLHGDAIAHFEGRAEADPPRWARYTREVIYHRFQLEGEAAGPVWHAAIDRAIANDDLTSLRELAVEVTGSEYVDDGEPRRRDETRLMIAPDTLARARLELAAASVQLAVTGALPAAAWSESARDLAAAEALAARASVSLPPARVAVVRAALEMHAMNAEGALAALDRARPLAVTSRERLDLEEARGTLLLLELNRSGADDSFRQAIAAASELGSPSTTRVRLGALLSRSEASRDRLTQARATCLETIEVARAHATERLDSLAVLLADIELWRGVPSAALALTAAGNPETAEGAFHSTVLACLQALALVDLRQPFEALRRLAERPRQTQGPRDPAADAMVDEIGAVINATLLNDGSALPGFDRARGLWSTVGALDDVGRIVRRCVLTQLRAGNLQAADVLLQEVRSLGLPGHSEEAVRLELVRAEVLYRHGSVDEAGMVLAALGDGAGWPPRVRARIALTALQLMAPARRRAGVRARLQALVKALDEVDDPSARLALLEPLVRCPVLFSRRQGDWSSALAERLLDRVRLPRGGEADVPARDSALRALRLADVYRVLGDSVAAQAALDEAGAIFAGDQIPFATRELLRAGDRIGWGHDGPPEAPADLEKLLALLGNYPVFCGVAALEHGERLQRARRARAAERWTSVAREYLGQEGTDGWHARLDELVARLTPSADAERARTLRRRASGIWERLGDRPAAERALSLVPADERLSGAAPVPSDPARGATDDVTVIRMTQETARVAVYVDSSTQPRPGVPSELNELVAPSLNVSEAARRHWIKLLAEDAREGGRVLGGVVGVRGLDRVRVAVRLEIDALPLHEVPWELMEAPDGTWPWVSNPAVRVFYRAGPRRVADNLAVRWLQRALRVVGGARLFVDGVMGPQTVEALHAFEREVGLGPSGGLDPLTRAALEARLRQSVDPGSRPLIVMLGPSQESADRAVRGLESLAAGVGVAYESAGRVTVVDDPRRLVAAPLADAAIVHVTGRFQDSTSRGGIVVDITGERSKGGAVAEPLSVARLDESLKKSAVPPFVVLDAARPSGASETLRQLFLRNGFAADLFARRNVSAVLATGLGDYEQQRLLVSTLRAGLEQHATVAEIAHEIRRSPPAEPTAILAVSGTALFAYDSELRPLLGAAP